MTATPTNTPSVRAELFGPERRATTVGPALLISLVAFEAMGVGTAMPALVADLGAVLVRTRGRSWHFIAAGRVLGTVVGGRLVRTGAGPRRGCRSLPRTLLSGWACWWRARAGTVAQLLLGRVLQGLGAGAPGRRHSSC